MFRIRLTCFLMAAMCMLCLAVPAGAAELDSGSVYCFAARDFSPEEALTGICITELPDSHAGTLLLGSRVIRPGDILTAAQTEQMTFASTEALSDRTVTVRYLPIFSNRVAPCSAMTISLRGREDKAPVSEDSAAETYKNLPNTGRLKVSDPEGQPLTYTLVRQPRRGSVTIGEDGSFTYTPRKNKVGVDSFTYTAADPAGNVSREATVTVTILKPTNAGQYADTAGRECRFAAEWMKHTGIFVGESLGDKSCFQPDKPVSRGEFVTMLVKTLEIPTDDYLTYTGYTDEIPQWLQPYLAAAIRSGLTDGLPGQDVFGSDTQITGAEVAVLLCNALDLRTDAEVMAYTDAPQWARSALAAAHENGFCLEAQQSLTREAAAGILYGSAKYRETLTSDTLV